MEMGFTKATKTKIKLRGAIFGPSGSGKTMTSLRILTGMGCKKIAVIDSERGSSLRYADRFEFDQLDLETKQVEEYIHWIIEAEKAGYDGLLIDSLSHAWSKILELVDRLAKTKYRGNSFRAWAEGTPLQNAFIDSVIGFNGHLIGTMRSKTEWALEQNSKGKVAPVRVGLSPNQGKEIEYEFDYLLEMNPEHFCTVIKDRTGKFQDKIIDKPDESFGKEIANWLLEGADAPENPQPPAYPPQQPQGQQQPPYNPPPNEPPPPNNQPPAPGPGRPPKQLTVPEIEAKYNEMLQRCDTAEKFDSLEMWLNKQGATPQEMKNDLQARKIRFNELDFPYGANAPAGQGV